MDGPEDTCDSPYPAIAVVFEALAMHAVPRQREASRPLERRVNRKPARVDALDTWLAKPGILNRLFFFAPQPLSDRSWFLRCPSAVSQVLPAAPRVVYPVHVSGLFAGVCGFFAAFLRSIVSFTRIGSHE